MLFYSILFKVNVPKDSVNSQNLPMVGVSVAYLNYHMKPIQITSRIGMEVMLKLHNLRAKVTKNIFILYAVCYFNRHVLTVNM